MNKARRAALESLVTRIEAIKEELQIVHDEESAAFDNLPEGLQQSEAGQAIETARDTMDEALGELENIVSNLGAI